MLIEILKQTNFRKLMKREGSKRSLILDSWTFKKKTHTKQQL